MMPIHTLRQQKHSLSTKVMPKHHSWQGQSSQVRHILKSSVLQPKLKIGASNDKYEREADQVADQVMRMSDEVSVQNTEMGVQRTPLIRNASSIKTQRMCAECEEEIQTKPLDKAIQRQEDDDQEELIQEKTTGEVAPQVTPAISSGIQSLNGGGQPLTTSERSFFEPRFGIDFSNVRVHNYNQAASVAKSINARAFTHGNNVVFGAGEYSSESSSGRKLLAHELTHVIQQNAQSDHTIQRYACPNSSSPRTANRSISGPIDWTVDFREGNINQARIDRTKDTSDITATAQMPGYLNNASLFNFMGLTEVRFGHQIITRPARRGRNASVIVRPRVRYPRIFITKDFPQGSCHFNAVRDFERATRHPVFLTAFLETIPIESELKALSLPTTFGDIEQIVLDWCARATASLEQGMASAHPVHVATLERNISNCAALSMVGCRQADRPIISAALAKAKVWIPGTIQRLGTPATVANQLNAHFSTGASPSAAHVQEIRDNYINLLAALNGSQLRFGCVNNNNGQCSPANTYGFAKLGSFKVNFCTRRYRGMGGDPQAAGLIHEVHHASVPGSLNVSSEAYSFEGSYPLAVASSIHNPDSYAEFAKAVH